jgi:RNA polymerase sigma factor (TIGR02999 family)
LIRQADDVTGLLARWNGGDREALGELMPVVYSELHRLAARALAGERRDHTLQPTALVHEAYLRLAGGRHPDWSDRAHFFAVAVRLMRRILVDHARGLAAARRGGGAVKVPLADSEAPVAAPPVELLALDEALDALAAVDPRKAQVVELRFFGGLTAAETAEILAVSVPTVLLDTRFARAWLYAHLRRGEGA